MKQTTLETLPIYNSTITYVSVVKGKKTTNEDEDNVSNMTDQTAEKNREDRNLEKKTKDQSKERRVEEQSEDDQSSIWSKESVVNKINMLTEELKKERNEREKEKREREKEREENKLIFEGIQQFQDLILNINDEDTDEEVGSQVKQIVRRIKKGASKRKSNEIKEKDNRQNEIEQEMSILKQSGLQSPPNNEKSDSSKFTTQSAVTEKR